MNELIAFCVGAVGYSIIEIMWRGYTHWTMALTGGICLFLIYTMNNLLNVPFVIKCLFGAIIITSLELAVGYVVNIKLGWEVWNYSSIPFNFMGQICVRYSVMWFFLCIPAVNLCNAIKSIHY